MISQLDRSQVFRLGLANAGLFLYLGCSSGPAAVEVPSFDADGAATQALIKYDTDKDGFIAGQELEKAPGLNAAIKSFDTDGDGKLSGEEIANRILEWDKMSLGMMNLTCTVLMDGQPLTGATVTFVPEEFLGGVTQQASDVTSPIGTASPKVPKENRPSPDSPPGIQAGLYKVRISKMEGGTEAIPARYNTETTLGQQVSKDDPAITNKKVIFDLKSK